MGKGIDLARADAPEHTRLLDDFKDQLLLVLIKRLGGSVEIPVSECDDTGGNLLVMRVSGVAGSDPVFHFEVSRKQ